MANIIPITVETPFANGYVNAFIVAGKTATLVDASNPGQESFRQLKSGIEMKGFRISDLDQIVLTHMHTDHNGGVTFLQEEAGLPVYVHEKGQFIIEVAETESRRVEEFFNQFVHQCGADLHSHQPIREYIPENWKDVHYLRDGDNLSIGGVDFEVIYVPGHSQTDVLFWDPVSRNAIGGDHIIANMSINAFVEPPSPNENQRPKPLLQYRKSLKRVKELPIKTIYPGHGEAFGDHVSLIDKRLEEQEIRCLQIHGILQKGAKTIYEISMEVFPRLRDRTVFLGLSQIQGHLDLMESRGQVEVSARNSILFYRLVK
ncbi:MBL fold metallo-hydrolase [Bacillus sp. CECT 9360]|uniref:MBL fold metallo-hydrolase n=1 Tax=Bacillus sp. CECT 9360 TaxID=2845821 RepID=UPI001E5BA915|nr:MBL fold metallo-hydrolase [Bacillus sp. CECT 9360]CAH0346062.1 Hydroxyacylglutathione hydrolase [Bacillus sp. CECT 9360]